MLNEFEMTGRTRTHITQLSEPRCAIHHDVVKPFLVLREAAAEEGMDIQPFSTFRDFQSQLKIWNHKFQGKRPLYSPDETLLDISLLTEEEKVKTILYWSMLPGGSRHHWGTEIDVFDQAAMPEGYRVQLLPHEYAQGGVFSKLGEWLSDCAEDFDFFRPYRVYQGGVCPEAWHLSYCPISFYILNHFTLDVLEETIRNSPVLGKEIIVELLPEIYERYIVNISPPLP